MKTLKIHTKTDNKGKATIYVDTSIPDSELDLIVQFEELPKSLQVSEKKPKYDLYEFVGKIKWDINPLEYQKKLRGEWGMPCND